MMQIGEVIRKFRKEQKLTQEEIADFLGVSATAVNKWEKGQNFPDILLLAPLARFLKTDVDTLLSFHENLTDLEIKRVLQEMPGEIEKCGYEAAFEKYKNMVREYPNCVTLMFAVAQMMNFYLPLQENLGTEKYERQITAWFEAVAESGEPVLAGTAVGIVCNKAISAGDYVKAEALAEKIPPLSLDRRILQANICKARGEYEKACALYEGMLYQSAGTAVTNIMQMMTLKCREGNKQEAQYLCGILDDLVDKLELSSYLKVNARLEMAADFKDRDGVLEAVDQMIRELTETKTRESFLYQNLTADQPDKRKNMLKLLGPLLEQDESFDFIRNEPKFSQYLQKIKEIAEA